MAGLRNNGPQQRPLRVRDAFAAVVLGIAEVESLPDVPSVPGVVHQTSPTSSLQGLLTNQPPAAVEATPGMWYTAFAGYPQTSATGVTFAPETRLAWANDPSLLPAFTSETVIGGPFGRNRAAAFPMTHSLTLVNYGANGVSAATNSPATLPGGSIISVLPTIGGAAAAPRIKYSLAAGAERLRAFSSPGTAVPTTQLACATTVRLPPSPAVGLMMAYTKAAG